VASLSQGRTAAVQCGLFTHKSVPVIFEPPCTFTFWMKISLIHIKDKASYCFMRDEVFTPVRICIIVLGYDAVQFVGSIDIRSGRRQNLTPITIIHSCNYNKFYVITQSQGLSQKINISYCNLTHVWLIKSASRSFFCHQSCHWNVCSIMPVPNDSRNWDERKLNRSWINSIARPKGEKIQPIL